MSLTSTKAFGTACILLAQAEDPYSEEAIDRVWGAFGVFDLTDNERATVIKAVGQVAHPGLLPASLSVIITAAVERAYYKRKVNRGTNNG